MSPFQAALIALLTALVSSITPVLALVIKDRFDVSLAKRLNEELLARAEALNAALAAQTAGLSENTRLTEHAAAQATAAFEEANQTNLKIERAITLGNTQTEALSKGRKRTNTDQEGA